MNKLLRFETKQNLRKPSRIYVKSVASKTLYGSFKIDSPQAFDGWGKLSQEETLELKQFIQNIVAVNKYLNPSPSQAMIDIRFRLPLDFVDAIEELQKLCNENEVPLDIYENMVISIIHQMRIATSKLEGSPKMKALAILDKANLADFKKQTHIEQIQSVFTEIQAIYNRSEKLHQKALNLFNKDKSYSPMAIKGMATGETLPSKWLASCAIDLLIDEQPEQIKKLLTANDLFILWAKPLKDSTYNQEQLLQRATLFESAELIEKIKINSKSP